VTGWQVIPRTLWALAGILVVGAVAEVVRLLTAQVPEGTSHGAEWGLFIASVVVAFLLLVSLLRGSRAAWWTCVVIGLLGLPLPFLARHAWTWSTWLGIGTNLAAIALLLSPSAREHRQPPPTG
jgi:hypothetical protein